MTSQPDKLFRDALGNFQRSAPTNAWGKIETDINKSSNKGLLLKIAAGFLLLCVAGFLLWPTGGLEKTSIAVKSNEPIKNIQKNKSNEVVASAAVGQKTESKNTPLKKKGIKKEDSAPVAKSSESKNEVAYIAPASIETPSSVQPIEEANPTTQPSRTIVYTAEEVNAKYLRKKSAPEATTETKKSSGIQKLMGLAYELKNTDNGLGDLRQKKNEILALNFLNEDKTKKEKN